MKRVFALVGAGAVSNAWAPVNAALREVYGPIHESVANHALANIIYQLRWATAAVTQLQEAPDPAVRASLDTSIGTYKRIRKLIAEHLLTAAANGTLCASPEATVIAEKFCRTHTTYVATTNWDVTLESAFAPGAHCAVDYIHGNVRRPETLYLPTEILDEPYRVHFPDEMPYVRALRNGVVRFMEHLRDADYLLVYGISLSSLDAELSVLLAQGWRLRGNRPFTEVVVINKEPERVIPNLKFSIGAQHVRGIAPVDLAACSGWLD